MENKCNNCHIEAEWQGRYNLATKRFDDALQKAINITMLAIIISLVCIIITVIMGLCVIKFINSFEYVEETIYSVEQDGKGTNTAVIGDENEVKVNGTNNRSD